MRGIAAEPSGIGPARTRVRLAVSLARRSLRSWLIWVFMFPNAMRLLGDKDADVGWVMAASMGIAFLFGLEVAAKVDSREHRVLPVTHRDLWVTEWLTAAVSAPLVLLLLKSIGAAMTGLAFISIETLLLSTLFDALYVSALLPVREWTLSAVNRPLRLDAPAQSLPVSIAKLLFLAPFPLLAAGAPLLFARQLPSSLSEFSTTSAILLMAAIVASVAAVIWTPSDREDTRLFQKAAPPAPAPLADQSKAATGLTGLATILWSHVKTTLVLTLVGIGMAMAAAPFLPPRDFNARFLLSMFLVFTWIGVSLSSLWQPWILRLRLLPLTVHQVNALLVLTPLVTWIEIWLILCLTHVALRLPIPVELSPLAILSYAGLCAMTHALTQAFSKGPIGRMGAHGIGLLAAAGMAMSLLEIPGIQPRPVFALVAAASFLLATVINHHSLIRSSSSALANRAFS
jgi:hypothetical protein